MCNILEWSADKWSAIASIAAALLTGGLLWIAWLAYNKLLVQEASKAQMDIILKVIDKLNHTIINVYKREGVSSSNIEIMFLTIFGFANRKKYSPDKNLELIFPAEWDNEFVQILVEFSDNPLTPKRIHDILIQFRKDLINADGEKANDADIFYAIGSRKMGSNFEIIKQYSFKGGINGFFTFCDNFTSELQKWLKKRGLKDTNSFIEFQATY